MVCLLQLVIGKNVWLVRKRRELTQDALAGMLDMDRCHLQDIESGISEVGTNRLMGLCAALKVSTDELTDGRPLRVADWKRMMAGDSPN